jgi:hypothetical protein
MARPERNGVLVQCRTLISRNSASILGSSDRRQQEVAQRQNANIDDRAAFGGEPADPKE